MVQLGAEVRCARCGAGFHSLCGLLRAGGRVPPAAQRFSQAVNLPWWLALGDVQLPRCLIEPLSWARRAMAMWARDFRPCGERPEVRRASPCPLEGEVNHQLAKPVVVAVLERFEMRSFEVRLVGQRRGSTGRRPSGVPAPPLF